MFVILLSTDALNYTGVPGLVQVAAESECGASLHGHRKCSQAGCPLGHLGESALEGGYKLKGASPEKQRGTRAMFTLTCNPALTDKTTLLVALRHFAKAPNKQKERNESVQKLSPPPPPPPNV
jgi:hypothetical protein